jgi:hypothetical protein
MFPSLDVSPGEYSLEWILGDRRIAGDVALAARRLPRITAYGEPGEVVADRGEREFPQTRAIPRLVGRLRSNLDIVVLDATLDEWFPGQSFGAGRWAIVGLGIASVPEDAYDRIRFQITDSDLWFGVPPLDRVTWPARDSPATEKTFSASLNPSAHQVWEDIDDGITIDCGYEVSYTFDPYHYGLAVAPVVDFYSQVPLRLDDWRDEWVQPLLGLAAFATKRPQTVSWLTVHIGSDRERQTGTVFAGGIDQAPYTADYKGEWRIDPERRPLFTLAGLSLSLPRVAREWRQLQSSDNPFVELYRLALFQPDLPLRARFLYLVQALEALHGYENREVEAERQMLFEERRNQVIEEAVAVGVSPQSWRFLRRFWSTRRPDSLDRRLAALLAALPVQLQSELDSNPELQPIRTALLEEDDTARTLPVQLRLLRNHLSHGDRNYDDRELRPWVQTVETVCRAHLLRLLGFDPSAIEHATSSPAS